LVLSATIQFGIACILRASYQLLLPDIYYKTLAMGPLIVADRIISTDPEGFLTTLADWDEAVACALAEAEGIKLTQEHWEVIWFLRNFYQEYQIAPAMRVLIKALAGKLGPEKGNSIYLHTLFPGGAAKQSNKLAGLPKPTRCI
jgi:TusE/DsrC/DsvC family sulfur relay protein